VIIPVLAALLVLLPGLLGGRLGRLAGLRLPGTGWLVAALLVQVVVLEAVRDPDGPVRVLLEALHVATYLVAAWFLWTNLRVPGLWLVGLGAASNGVTIAANGGTLPARAEALRTAGIEIPAGQFANSAALVHPHLWFLGDVFAIPARFPLANVFSVGDLLILLGAAAVSLRICGTRWSAPWRPPARFRRPYPTTRSYGAATLAAARLAWVPAPRPAMTQPTGGTAGGTLGERLRVRVGRPAAAGPAAPATSPVSCPPSQNPHCTPDAVRGRIPA
jgi:hypothetical protein